MSDDEGKNVRRPAAPPIKKLDQLHVPPLVKIESKFEGNDDEDKKFIDSTPQDSRAALINAIRDIIELNGTGDIPGVQASYIEVPQYVQWFDDVKCSDGMKKALYLAHNWAALGKGVGGLAGAAVRWSLRGLYTAERELTRHRVVPNGSAALIQEYDKAAMANKELVNFFITNAQSVAALAGAMINKIVHHWDANHTGPQKAFISAMGMADALPPDQFRPVFYLAIHPLPLSVTERLRNDSALGRNPEVAEVVRLRCVGPPAGYGAINACAAAAHSFLAERMMNPETWAQKDLPELDGDAPPDEVKAHQRELARVVEHNEKLAQRSVNVLALREKIMRLAASNQMLVDNAPAYHQFANKYGYEKRLVLDVKEHEAAMIVLAAYIFGKVKGTLAQSAAVRKFRDQHAREVNKKVQAFNAIEEDGDAYETIGI
jgi:hypothetical protein